MPSYFPSEASLAYKMKVNIPDTLETIANRYMANNPAYPFQMRAFSENGFIQTKKGLYDLDLSAKFPAAKLGQLGYVYAMLWSDSGADSYLSMSVQSPTSLYLNGKQVYRSIIGEERDSSLRTTLVLPLQQGWNSFLVKIQKSPTGFGCKLGSTSSKWAPLHFMSPFADRLGQAGWIYSDLSDADVFPEGNEPSIHQTEESTGIQWHPTPNEGAAIFQDTDGCTRLFGRGSGRVAYGWSKLFISEIGGAICTLSGKTSGAIRIWVNDHELISQQGNDDIHFEWKAAYGSHDMVVESCAGEQQWGFTLEARVGGGQLDFRFPSPVQGASGSWMFLGPFDDSLPAPPSGITDLSKLHVDREGGVYWKLESPGFCVRPYLENKLFGRWNYHLGVTLNGLLRTSKLLGREDIRKYAAKHIDQCVKMYEYSLFDRDKYGYQSLNQQLVELDSLDDCGAFGAAILELYEQTQNSAYLPLLQTIAAYMKNEQIRRADGAFYRGDDTMWADDLYMSTPFLAGYYKLTGERTYIDDAAQQFLLFKKYLYMPELQIMSHVYDFKHETPTYVPWGRGNGWVLFSLAEVLEALPDGHKDQEPLLAFYRELCEGCLRLQGHNGLWHQVLTDAESYEETSCTAMFTYGFAKGVRHGWLSAPEPYAAAVDRAWQGLSKHSVDELGNVHGVCRGSNFSFSEAYYKFDLLWVENDTHGTGIVMLAGDEIRKMLDQLANGAAYLPHTSNVHVPV